MKRHIIMVTISFYSLTWTMEHKAESSFAKTSADRQPDHLKPLFNPTPPQSTERSQDANLLLPRLPGHATRNTTSLHQTSIFTVHPAKL